MHKKISEFVPLELNELRWKMNEKISQVLQSKIISEVSEFTSKNILKIKISNFKGIDKKELLFKSMLIEKLSKQIYFSLKQITSLKNRNKQIKKILTFIFKKIKLL